MHKPLHIVSFDNPYPPVYGGTIEVYFKIKALHELGYTIYLHCFTRRTTSADTALSALVAEVYFYKVGYSAFHLLSSLPFSVISRNHKSLVDNILKVEAPILYESLRTTLSVNDIRLQGFKKILRMHNIEHNYHAGIAKSENSLIKKLLNRIESRRFRKYENIIAKFDALLTLSEHEQDYANRKYGKSYYVPVFHGNAKVTHLDGIGNYALYHGDLTIADNKKTACFLIDIFKKIEYQLVIASGTNEEFVKNLIGQSDDIKFVQLKDFEHLKQLLNDAHINLLWSFQRSGTKLKVINTLFHSRHCIVNDNIIDDPEVLPLCNIANTKEELVRSINEIKCQPFEHYHQRAEVLENYFSDNHNALKINAIIEQL